MLARLQKSVSFRPSLLTRSLSTTSVAQAKRKPPPSDAEAAALSAIEDIILSPKASSSTSLPAPTPSSVPVKPPRPANGLSYAGLPEHQIFLQLPPASDPLLTYITSLLTRDGRRATAARRVSRMLLYLHAFTRAEPLGLFREAVQKVAPLVRFVRQVRGTRFVQIPVAIQEKQRTRDALKWMLNASETRGGRTVEERLAREIVLVLNGTSSALRQKASLHEQAAANRCVVFSLLLSLCY